MACEEKLQKGVFRKEGEYWTVGVGDKAVRLKDSKGLAYISYLLHHPGVECHALDLAGGNPGGADKKETDRLELNQENLEKAGIHIGSLGDAGEVIDDQAKNAYRRRLSELHQELEDATALGKVDEADRLEGEIDALTRELSRAVGLGGRRRRAASASERARQTVTKVMRTVIERVARSDAALGEVLTRCIRTGTFCSYQPDPDLPIQWEFADNSGDSRAELTASTGFAPSGADSVQPSPGVLSVIPFSTAQRTSFVGRESESAVVQAAIDRGRGGSGSLLMLGGGPGVGKTRLATEMAEYALRNGFACFLGRCYERDEPHPLMPFVEIIEAVLAQASSIEQFRTLLASDAGELAQIAPGLRRMIPDLPSPPELPTPQVRRYLFQSLFDFIARMSQARPSLLVLDDLQWADESTLAMVNFVAHRVEHVPAVVLGAYRDEELDTSRPLTRTLEELLRLGIHPLKLQGLTRSAIAQMLADLSRRQPPEHVVSLIFDETQGNPFFVEEVFSHLVEEGMIFDAAGNFRPSSDDDELTVPENVRLVLGRRLDRLSDNAREVLSAASVIGRSFSFLLLQAVVDRTDPDTVFAGLEEAQRARFIGSSSQGEPLFVFSHELVRQTLLAGISLPRQQHLHLKIAQALERVYDKRIEEHAAEVAHHLLKSGAFADAGKASYYLSLAGQGSLRAGALEDARRSLSAALAYQQTDGAKHAKTLASLACAERGLGDWSAAIAHLQDSLGLYASAGDLRSIGRVVFEMVETFVWTGHLEAAAEIAERGLSHLRKDESAYRARLLAARGLIYGSRGEFSRAMSAFDEALASPAVTPFLARVFAYRSLCHFYFLQVQDALQTARKSAASSNPQDSPWTHALALSIAMRSLYHLGQPGQALRIGMELEPLAKSVGQLGALSICQLIQSWAEFGREPELAILDGRIGNAVNFQRGTRLSFFLAQSLAQMSLVRFFAGDWDSAWLMAEEARATELPGAFAGPGAAMLLRLAAYSAGRDRVLELVDQTRAQLPEFGQTNTIGGWSLQMGMVEALVMVGERGRAAELYPQVRELLACGAIAMSFGCRFPETVAGMAAGAAGNWELAEQHFGLALQQAVEFPHRLEEAEVQRFHAMMLLERSLRDDRERARKLLLQAAESYGRIGMPRHAELARSLLAKRIQ